MKFTELDLSPPLLQALEQVGFAETTPIQELVIPQVLIGKDVSGLAQTGTGKTGAFVIPLIDRIIRCRNGEQGPRVPGNWRKNSYVLVLVPTRELAQQVEECISKMGSTSQMRSVVIVGGSSYDDQRRALREGVEFVVGTPGRVLDLYKTHDLDLNGVACIVFDEADRMFDMGFRDDMKFILRRVPRDRQFLLFSATLNFDVLNTAYQFGSEPVEFNVSRDKATAEGVEHEILHIGQLDKPKFLLSILKKQNPKQCMVFSNFKHQVSRIAKFLRLNGLEAIEMSSLLTQAQRNKVFDAFRTGEKSILVATDVAARGLDIKGVDLVINFDLPDDPEGYVHRIGRTGRAGTTGKAIGLVSDRDVEALQRIETYLKDKVKTGWMEDTDLIQEFKPFPTHDDRPADGNGPKRFQSGGNGPRRGPQQHAPRPPRQGKPHPPRRETPSVPSGHGQVADGTSRVGPHEHRDRRLGRHGSRSGTAKAHSQDQTQGQKPHGQKHHRPHRQHKPHQQNGSGHQAAPLKRRPLTGSKDAPKSSSEIVKKVKGFFSRLFR
ncbi:MAG: DEAD/DEAH box helicase [Oligoflexia bacterium]|nr:DEAD/DEAH box helicase [Oligoflexia bacterium]